MNMKQTIIFALSTVVLLSYIPASCAADKPKVDRVKLKASLSQAYLLGPGDEIFVQDRTLNDLDAKTKEEEHDIIISGDGTIALPLPNGRQSTLYVAGLTLQEASEAVIAEYSKIMKYPIVFVRMGKRRPVKVFVAGAVTKPGIYKLDDGNGSVAGANEIEQKTRYGQFNGTGFPLFQLIQLVGGLKPRADITKITVTRGNGLGKKVFNLQKLISGNEPFQEFDLQSGDTVFVPVAENPKLQAQNHSDLLGWLAYQEVPVSVVGEAKKPGNFILSNGSTILDAIGNAGGLNEVGTLKKIRLSRFDGNGKYNTEIYNVHDLIYGNVSRDEIRVKPGDRIELVASKGKLVRHFFNENARSFIQALIFPATQSLGNYIVQDALQDDVVRVSD